VQPADIVQLARPRPGHFDLGTGYHGDLWLDLDALFLRPALLRPHVRQLADQLSGHAPDAVCGPLEGGAFLACALADLLGVAFLPGYRSAEPRPAIACPGSPAASAAGGSPSSTTRSTPALP